MKKFIEIIKGYIEKRRDESELMLRVFSKNYGTMSVYDDLLDTYEKVKEKFPKDEKDTTEDEIRMLVFKLNSMKAAAEALNKEVIEKLVRINDQDNKKKIKEFSNDIFILTSKIEDLRLKAFLLKEKFN